MEKIQSIINQWTSKNSNKLIDKSSIKVKHSDEKLDIHTIFFKFKDAINGKTFGRIIKALPNEEGGYQIINLT